jgi:hypothetical protein
MDITQLVGTVGIPGVICILLLRQNGDLRKTIEANTQALYLIAGKLGVPVKGGTSGGSDTSAN